jgi:hypothetical protein
VASGACVGRAVVSGRRCVGSDSGDEDEVVSTINTTPLVDVMLVLLIIFLITIPVVTTSIPVQLPKETNEIRETKLKGIGKTKRWVLRRPEPETRAEKKKNRRRDS